MARGTLRSECLFVVERFSRQPCALKNFIAAHASACHTSTFEAVFIAHLAGRSLFLCNGGPMHEAWPLMPTLLAFVVLLVAEILLTDPRRGATTPRDLELFLNRVRPCRALAARRTRPDVETRSQTTNCHTAARDRSDSIDRDAPPQLTLDQSALPSLDWNCLVPIPTDARPLRAG